jgi:hypothetical protein
MICKVKKLKSSLTTDVSFQEYIFFKINSQQKSRPVVHSAQFVILKQSQGPLFQNILFSQQSASDKWMNECTRQQLTLQS